ncbi:Pyridoxamine 5'-phosphate oxidase [Fodinibius salinus]|uniref:Pyridoxamine 5'-phosphate oxidase n=1 Tax=Fodinibius salinus TaxID=860790 RepID=A0A5D3YHI8_9BACT|nr:pyridoxamine 5'-phosphate oxidase [Fodinibius salinus]TYP92747.1 Pyridoxamine 5'-phosphate oxidase [Fodinibius salinus]
MGGNKDKADIAQIRRDYSLEKLSASSINDDPIKQFSVWFEKAIEADLIDANAMTLSTASQKGQPSSRIVLLKGVDKKGFRFYSNYASRKGKELAKNPYASLCFYWAPHERQVRIEGKVEQLNRQESAAYFQARPRLSQIGAWASKQSTKVSSREELESRFKKIKKRFAGKDIPLPDFWGGYLLRPERMEFWQGREGRLHDRICYKKKTEGWESFRLAP